MNRDRFLLLCLLTVVLLSAPSTEPAAEGNAKTPPERAITAEDREHWSYQPNRNPKPPSVKNKQWIRTPIDRFILARLESEGLTPARAAVPRSLLRRLYLDLTGLPPNIA